MKRYWKLFCMVSLLLATFLIARHYGWTTDLLNRDRIEQFKVTVEAQYVKAIFIYLLLTVICCVFLALPGITFALFAGVLFGPVMGTFLCLMGTTIGASLAFLAGRYFLKDAIKPWVQKRYYLRRLLFEDIEKSGMLLLMITRLLPVFPYNLQNFAYGITDMKFLPYTFYTFIFLAPGVAFFTIGAAGIAVRENHSSYILVLGVLALFIFVSGSYLRKNYLK